MQTLEQCYDQTFDQVFGYVMTRVRNRQVTENIVSEVYLKIAEHFDDFKPREHASRRSWVFAIVRNHLVDTYRKQTPANDELPDDLQGSSGAELEHELDTLRDYELALSKLDSLPDRQREILLLRYKGELKNTEIAELLQIDQRTVSATLSKAISTLRAELTKEPAYAV